MLFEKRLDHEQKVRHRGEAFRSLRIISPRRVIVRENPYNLGSDRASHSGSNVIDHQGLQRQSWVPAPLNCASATRGFAGGHARFSRRHVQANRSERLSRPLSSELSASQTRFAVADRKPDSYSGAARPITGGSVDLRGRGCGEETLLLTRCAADFYHRTVPLVTIA